MRKSKIIILFFCISLKVLGQAPQAAGAELVWASFHPFAALKIKKITKKCYNEIDIKKVNSQLDQFNNGGKADAYRHSFFMAAYAQKIKVKKLRKLGKAHEKTNYRQFRKSKTEDGEVADRLSSVMDLKNNELGFAIGSLNKNLPLEELSQLVISEIKNGKAVVMKRDLAGNYLDCEGRKIDLSLYLKKWGVPKCLVASSQTN